MATVKHHNYLCNLFQETYPGEDLDQDFIDKLNNLINQIAVKIIKTTQIICDVSHKTLIPASYYDGAIKILLPEKYHKLIPIYNWNNSNYEINLHPAPFKKLIKITLGRSGEIGASYLAYAMQIITKEILFNELEKIQFNVKALDLNKLFGLW